MINQTKNEADMIKVLREIKIMRKLNAISKSYLKASKLTKTAQNGSRNLYIPELIDIICPLLPALCPSTGITKS